MSSNTLNNKHLAKNATNTNKKTIDINKTTTATTEEKSCCCRCTFITPNNTRSHRTLAYADRQTHRRKCLAGRGLHAQRLWQLLKTHIKEAVEVFRQHVILHDNGNVLNMKDTRQYFVNFVRAGQRTSQELHMLLQGLEKPVRRCLPTPTATSCLWTDGAPTWAAPSPTERHPDRTIPPSGTKLPVRGRRKPPPSSKKPKQKPG